jgi:predicted transglutaminase-like cysteine proteinase
MSITVKLAAITFAFAVYTAKSDVYLDIVASSQGHDVLENAQDLLLAYPDEQVSFVTGLNSQPIPSWFNSDQVSLFETPALPLVTPQASLLPSPESISSSESAQANLLPPSPQFAYAAPAAPEAMSRSDATKLEKGETTPAPLVLRKLPGRKTNMARSDTARAHVEQIRFDMPTLAPFAHTRFCSKYADECRPDRMMFRPNRIAMNADRLRELTRVNTQVNRDIRPTRVNETIAGEQWLISPKSGDCNDYAVTKRHELLAKGWPSRGLLLAEVITTWGEHHLVLVVRTRNGDMVADNLNANLRVWNKTAYQWVRVQSPANPKYWSTIKAPAADVVTMASMRAAEGGL